MNTVMLSVSTEVVSGAGAAKSLGSVLLRRGISQVVIVTGKRTEQLTLFKELCAGLKESGVGWVSILREDRFAMMNDVENIATALRDGRSGAVVGVGGGSAIDLAKVGAIVAAEGSPAEQHAVQFTPPDIITIPELRKPKLPVIAVPTMFSGSEGNGSGQIRGGIQRFARSFRDDSVLPSVVVIDPLAGEGQTPVQAVSTGFNALANCITGLYTRMRSPFSDGCAAEGARLLLSALPILAKDPADPVARVDAGWGSLLSGLVIRHAFGGLHHAVSHALVNRVKFEHATSNALMLPHSVSWHFDNLAGRDLERLQAALPSNWNEIVRATSDAIGLPGSLEEAGIAESLIDELVAEASHERAIANELMKITESELRDVFVRAYRR